MHALRFDVCLHIKVGPFLLDKRQPWFRTKCAPLCAFAIKKYSNLIINYHTFKKYFNFLSTLSMKLTVVSMVTTTYTPYVDVAKWLIWLT